MNRANKGCFWVEINEIKGCPICVQCNFQDIDFLYTMIKKDNGLCNLRHPVSSNFAVLLYHNK